MDSVNAKVQKSVWQGPGLVNQYCQGIEVSTDDVHYGNLASGEKKLQLLGRQEDLVGKTVLEVGCGEAQNCIALAKWGANCVGVDISEEVIRRAKILAREKGVNITLIVGDTCNLPVLPITYFDIVLSSYTLGFVGNIKQAFRQINYHLEVSGKFVFCLRHPIQNPDKDDVDSIFLPEKKLLDKWEENNFTINQIVIWLSHSGFLVERIVEQITKNPSQLSQTQQAQYPYRFKVKLDPRYDASTHLPHTIIYCCRKIRESRAD